MTRRISDAVRRDFQFALECERKLGGMCGFEDWPDGDASALEAFKKYDCEGKKIGCDDADIVRAMRGKASLNWHIKNWAIGIAEGLFLAKEFKEAHPWLPDWAWSAMEETRKSLLASGSVEAI